MVTELPLWFGPRERSLFGVLHSPEDGTCRGGVVLCPPLGYEYICTHRTFRTTADALAQAGFVALRFDYDGTGDSAGTALDPDRVASWRSSIEYAIEVIRSAGATSVFLLGMRFGALLASDVGATRPDIAGLVLWDPFDSGRSFRREIQALHGAGLRSASASPDEAGSGLVECAGAVYSARTVDEIARVELSPPAPGTPVLLLARPDRPDKRLHRVVDRWEGLTWSEASGQDRLIDGESSTAIVPLAALRAVVGWIASHAPSEPTLLRSPRARDRSVAPEGVTERVTFLGSRQLFAIVTEGEVQPERPTLVCLNNASDHHVGPARMWVDWGRAMAERGWRTIRMDVTGVGDSPSVPGETLDKPYPDTGVADLTSALEEACPDGAVVIGLCSGGRTALDLAIAFSHTRAAVAINSALHTPRAFHRLISPETPYPPPIYRINNQPIRSRLHGVIPPALWKAWSVLGHGPEMPRQLQAIDARDVDVVLVFGRDEYSLWKARRNMRWVFTELSKRNRFRILDVPGLDHSMMLYEPRLRVGELLTAHLETTFGSTRQAEPVPAR